MAVTQSAFAQPLFSISDHKFYPIIRISSDGAEHWEDSCFTCNEPRRAHK